MQVRLWLESIVRVVRELGGYFTFEVGGEEYVVMRKADFKPRMVESDEAQRQLSLDEEEASQRRFVRVGEVMEKYQPARLEPADNEGEEEGGFDFSGDIKPEDIPLDREAPENELEIPGVGDEIESEFNPETMEAGTMKVRFEPLKGDLPPDLQE